ncbi:hypothetical protein KM043_002002 [Ampulex compressa]|nr:hypothetical protein KM043_002002 [Ampulex compressa]
MALSTKIFATVVGAGDGPLTVHRTYFPLPSSANEEQKREGAGEGEPRGRPNRITFSLMEARIEAGDRAGIRERNDCFGSALDGERAKLVSFGRAGQSGYLVAVAAANLPRVKHD